jgi:imidazolonepropionase-like amidohydrolase
MRSRLGPVATTIVAVCSLGASVVHAESSRPDAVLFQNVRIFDGKGGPLSASSNVLVRANRIERISTAPIPVEEGAGTRVVPGDGRTLMPGLIDAHWHTTQAAAPLQVLMTADFGYLYLLASREAERTLMRGFTSVRDVGGPAFGLKRAIDEGVVSGPRIWPSGASISQSGGHGDFRFPFEMPASRQAPLSRSEATNAALIADGPDEVLKRVREQLALGASQIKLHAGGGVSSLYDPIDVAQYTEAEFLAAVEAAKNWGTYVTVHAYTPGSIQAAVRAGVKCIEHGQLMDEPTAELLAREGVWLSLQPFLDNEFSNPQTGDARAKQLQMYAGTDAAYGLAKKHGIRTAWGSDMLFQPTTTSNQGALLATMVRWYTPAEVLAMATSTNAELLALSGPRNPYPGKLGVVEEGALADLLLVDGDPTEDIQLIADPDKNLLVIMKDGRLFKDRLR